MIEITDRRVARTHNMLLEAMIALLGKYDWNDINVQQICDKADIARSTFYSHFENKQELYDFGFARLEAHIQNAVAEKATGRSLDENRKFGFLPELLDHIKQHQPIFCSTDCGEEICSSNELVFSRFKTLIFGFIKTEIETSKFARTMNGEDITFISGGIFALMNNWWTGNTKMPVDQVLAAIDVQLERVLAE